MTENINEDHEMVLPPSLIDSLDVEHPLENTKKLGVLDRIMDQVYRINNGFSDVLENLEKMSESWRLEVAGHL